MSLNFVQILKMVDENYKCFVHGYIRQRIINKYKIANIPSSIIDLCIVFSYVLFEWDLDNKHKDVIADNETFTVKVMTGKSVGNIYSKNILNAKAIYMFKMKIKNHSCGIWGIVNADQTANDPSIERKAYGLYAKDAYGYGGAFGYKYQSDPKQLNDRYGSYSDKPGGKDNKEAIVDIIFDKIKGTLSYKLDDKDLGIAWRNIDIEKEYRFATYISGDKEIAQLIDFRIKWQNTTNSKLFSPFS